MTFHALPNFRSRTTGRRTTCRATQITRPCAPSSNEGEIGVAAPIRRISHTAPRPTVTLRHVVGSPVGRPRRPGLVSGDNVDCSVQVAGLR